VAPALCDGALRTRAQAGVLGADAPFSSGYAAGALMPPTPQPGAGAPGALPRDYPLFQHPGAAGDYHAGGAGGLGNPDPNPGMAHAPAMPSGLAGLPNGGMAAPYYGGGGGGGGAAAGLHFGASLQFGSLAPGDAAAGEAAAGAGDLGPPAASAGPSALGLGGLDAAAHAHAALAAHARPPPHSEPASQPQAPAPPVAPAQARPGGRGAAPLGACAGALHAPARCAALFARSGRAATLPVDAWRCIRCAPEPH